MGKGEKVTVLLRANIINNGNIIKEGVSVLKGTRTANMGKRGSVISRVWESKQSMIKREGEMQKRRRENSYEYIDER